MRRNGTARRVAVVGAGISGIAAAHRLHQRGVDVTLFEREAALGGHAYTYGSERTGGHDLPMGVVLLQDHYVNLFAFLREAGARVRRLDAQVSAYLADKDAGLELRISKKRPLQGFLRDPSSRRLRLDALKSLSRTKAYLRDRARGMEELTFGDYLERYGYSEEARFVFPAIAGPCFLSNSVESVSAAPASAIIHCIRRQRALQYPLMRIPNHYYDRTMGESLGQVCQPFADKISLDRMIDRVDGDESGAVLSYNGREIAFDSIVLSTSTGYQALSMLGHGATETEIEVLGRFTSQRNELILHTDDSLLEEQGPGLTFNLVQERGNILISQDLSATLGLDGNDRYLLSTHNGVTTQAMRQELSNTGFREPNPDCVITRKLFDHPVVSAGQWHAIEHNLLDEIQGKRNIYYAGSWANAGEGSHEMAYLSGRRAAALVLDEPFAPRPPQPVSALHDWISGALCLAGRPSSPAPRRNRAGPMPVH